jgi:hypothetical protein
VKEFSTRSSVLCLRGFRVHLLLYSAIHMGGRYSTDKQIADLEHDSYLNERSSDHHDMVSCDKDIPIKRINL